MTIICIYSIIRISNVKKSDEGTYEVCAKNREGEATNTLVLNVKAKEVEAKPVVEKVPILVTARATVDNSAVRRVPITTPSTTTSTTTTVTTSTTQEIIKDSSLVRNPKNRNDQFKKERSGQPNVPSGTIKKDNRQKPQFDTSRTRNDFPKQSSGTRKNVEIVETSINSGKAASL